MNSQDKPIEANDNLDESLETSDAIQQGDENSVDLWSGESDDPEIVTEFISVETAAQNDAEAFEEITSDGEVKPRKQKKKIELDLDNWDFRNLSEEDSAEIEFDEDIDLNQNSSIEEFSEIGLLPEEAVAQINPTGTSKPEMDDLGPDELDESEDLELVESIAQESLGDLDLDDSLEEPVLSLDSTSKPEMDDLGPDELDESEDLELVESIAQESLGDLDLDDSLEEPVLSLDSTSKPEMDDLGPDELDESEDLELVESIAPEELRDLDLDDSDDSLEEPVLSLDSTSKPEMDDFGPDELDESEDLELVESIAQESLGDLDLDDSLEEPVLSLDSTSELEMDDLGPDELDESEDLELVGSIAPEELRDLDLDDSLEEPVLSLDSTSELELEDFGSDELDESEDLELVESIAQESLGDFDLDNSLEEPVLSLDSTSELELEDFGSDELDESEDLELVESIAQESLGDFDLDNSLEEPVLSLDSTSELELEDLGLDGLDELEPADDLAIEALDNLGDSDLDDLFSLDSDTESLDSLVVGLTTELEPSLDLLDSDLGSADLDLDLDLDSLLDDEPQTAPVLSTPSIPSPEPATARSTTPSAPSPVTKAQAFDQTMRVSVRKLDNLNNLIGELVVKRNRLEDDQERLRRFLDNLLGHVQSLGEAGAKMHDMYERSLLEGALMASRQSRANAAVAAVAGSPSNEPQEEGLDALEMDRFNGFHLLSQDIIELIVRVREAASDIQFVVDETDKVAQTFRQVTSQLQDGMNSSRMVAFGQAADRLPRAVRDISRKQKKQTTLHVEGKDVLIDKMIVEHLYNPMTHLVNNAISHGIEQPEERLKKGKTEDGNVYIQAFIQGNQTVITVRDDGAGIDPEKVKQKAIEKNLITWAIAQNLSEQQVYELLFHPGFSTKDEADDFAGRGVGMDVVNTDLKKIRGSVSTESELGQGTIFTIRLPLVLSICKAITCVDNNSRIAFPIDGVEDTKEYLPSDIQTNHNGVRCISWKNTLLPLRPLNSLLTYNREIRRAGLYNVNQNNDDTISVIILRSLDNLLAVEVEEIKAEQEIVIKQIDGPVAKPPGIAGATVLGDGTIIPIGDVLELIEIAQGKRTIEIGFNILAGEGAIKQAQAENVQQEPMVLVVDDSITVRELLSMSFNKLGYRVEQARDGQEAWDKLSGGLACDMIFSDIEMPRMNGLELLSNLHQDSKLKSIPVAMLTSRGADKHRQIANDLGAKAYLTKPYTEKDLMDVAQHLIEIDRANKEAASATVNLKKIKKRQTETEFKNAPLVLIIDDSVTVRELLSMSFKKAGYRVEQARDGQEAWEKLNDGLECDLAFCDIEMPRMNGLELLAQLQKDEKLANLPIAMLTSRGAQKMRNLAASRGANGYFVKPYVEEELLKAAEKMMEGEMLIESAAEED